MNTSLIYLNLRFDGFGADVTKAIDDAIEVSTNMRENIWKKCAKRRARSAEANYNLMQNASKLTLSDPAISAAPASPMLLRHSCNSFSDVLVCSAKVFAKRIATMK